MNTDKHLGLALAFVVVGMALPWYDTTSDMERFKHPPPGYIGNPTWLKDELEHPEWQYNTNLIWIKADVVTTNDYGVFYAKDFTNIIGVSYTNSTSAKELITIAKSYVMLTNLVNELVTSGEVCRVRGHVWHYGKNGDDYYGLTFDTEFKTSRRCAVCGKIETRVDKPWK